MSDGPSTQLVIEQLSGDVLHLEQQCEAYRAVAREALAQLHEVGLQHGKTVEQLHAAREELRRFTAAQVI